MSQESTPLRQLELRGPALGDGWNLWILRIGAPYFKKTGPNQSAAEGESFLDQTHPVRVLAHSPPDPHAPVPNLRAPRLLDAHVIAGVTDGRYRNNPDYEQLRIRPSVARGDVRIQGSDPPNGPARRPFRTGPSGERAPTFARVLATPVTFESWPAPRSVGGAGSWDDAIQMPPLSLFAGAIPLTLGAGDAGDLAPLLAQLDFAPEAECTLTLTPEGIELAGSFAFLEQVRPARLTGRFLLAPSQRSPGGVALRLDVPRANDQEASAWAAAWRETAAPLLAGQPEHARLTLRTHGPPPAFEWDVAWSEAAGGYVVDLDRVHLPTQDVRVELYGGGHGRIDGIAAPAPHDVQLVASAESGISQLRLETPPVETEGAAIARYRATRSDDGEMRNESFRVETPDAQPLVLGYEERRLAAVLREAYGLPEPADRPAADGDDGLYLFVPVERGWLQVPVPNLRSFDADEDVLPPTRAAARRAMTGFARYSSSSDEAPWSLSLEGAREAAFVWTARDSGDGLRLEEIALAFHEPSLDLRGLLLHSIDRPDDVEALPRYAAGPASIVDLPLETTEALAEPGSVRVELSEIEVDLVGEPRLLRSRLDVRVPDVRPCIVWLRHPSLPLLAAAALTRSAAASSRPLESRQYAPFRVEGLLELHRRAGELWPKLRANRYTPFHHMIRLPVDPEDGSPRSGIPFVAIGLPGVEVAPGEPLGDEAWSNLAYAYRFDLPVLDELFASATLPGGEKPASGPEVTAMRPALLEREVWKRRADALELARTRASYAVVPRTVATDRARIETLLTGAALGAEIALELPGAEEDAGVPSPPPQQDRLGYGRLKVDVGDGAPASAGNDLLPGLSGTFALEAGRLRWLDPGEPAPAEGETGEGPSELRAPVIGVRGWSPETFDAPDGLTDNLGTARARAERHAGLRRRRIVGASGSAAYVTTLEEPVVLRMPGSRPWSFWFRDLPLRQAGSTWRYVSPESSEEDGVASSLSEFEWRLYGEPAKGPKRSREVEQPERIGREALPFLALEFVPHRLDRVVLTEVGAGVPDEVVVTGRLRLSAYATRLGADRDLVTLTFERRETGLRLVAVDTPGGHERGLRYDVRARLRDSAGGTAASAWLDGVLRIDLPVRLERHRLVFDSPVFELSLLGSGLQLRAERAVLTGRALTISFPEPQASSAPAEGIRVVVDGADLIISADRPEPELNVGVLLQVVDDAVMLLQARLFARRANTASAEEDGDEPLRWLGAPVSRRDAAPLYVRLDDANQTVTMQWTGWWRPEFLGGSNAAEMACAGALAATLRPEPGGAALVAETACLDVEANDVRVEAGGADPTPLRRLAMRTWTKGRADDTAVGDGGHTDRFDVPVPLATDLRVDAELVAASSLAWPARVDRQPSGAGAGMPPADAATSEVVVEIPDARVEHRIRAMLLDHALPVTLLATHAGSASVRLAQPWSVLARIDHELRVPSDAGEPTVMAFRSVDHVRVLPVPPVEDAGLGFVARYHDPDATYGQEDMHDHGIGFADRVFGGFDSAAFREIAARSSAPLVTGVFLGVFDAELEGAGSAQLVRLPWLVGFGDVPAELGAGALGIGGIGFAAGPLRARVAWIDALLGAPLRADASAALTVATAEEASLEAAVVAGTAAVGRAVDVGSLVPPAISEQVVVIPEANADDVAADVAADVELALPWIGAAVSVADLLERLGARAGGLPAAPRTTSVAVLAKDGAKRKRTYASLVRVGEGPALPVHGPTETLLVTGGDELRWHRGWQVPNGDVGTLHVAARTAAEEAHPHPRFALLRHDGEDGTVRFAFGMPAPRGAGMGIPHGDVDPRSPALPREPNIGWPAPPAPGDGSLLAPLEPGGTRPLRDDGAGGDPVRRPHPSGIAGLSVRVGLPHVRAAAVRIDSGDAETPEGGGDLAASLTWLEHGRAPMYPHTPGAPIGRSASRERVRPRLPAAAEVAAGGRQHVEAAPVRSFLPVEVEVLTVGERPGVLTRRTLRLMEPIGRGAPLDQGVARFGGAAQGGSVLVQAVRTPRPGVLPPNTGDARRDRRVQADPLTYWQNARLFDGPADVVRNDAQGWIATFHLSGGLVAEPWDGTLSLAVRVATSGTEPPDELLRRIVHGAAPDAGRADGVVAELVIGETRFAYTRLALGVVRVEPAPAGPIEVPIAAGGETRSAIRRATALLYLSGAALPAGRRERTDSASVTLANAGWPPRAEARLTVHALRPAVTARLPIVRIGEERRLVPMTTASLVFTDPAYEAELSSLPAVAVTRITLDGMQVQARLYADRVAYDPDATVAVMLDVSAAGEVADDADARAAGGVPAGSTALRMRVLPKDGSLPRHVRLPGVDAETVVRLAEPYVFRLADLIVSGSVGADSAPARLAPGDVLELACGKEGAGDRELAAGVALRDIPFGPLHLPIVSEPVLPPPGTVYSVLSSDAEGRLEVPLHATSPLPTRVDFIDLRDDFRRGLVRRTAQYVWPLLVSGKAGGKGRAFVVKTERSGQSWLAETLADFAQLETLVEFE